MSDIFSPYQIDYAVKNTSKTFGFSKKKIIFKFGIANPPAVADGQTGANCRGSEHEVIFTWSLNSGKRQIICDGKDIHYSETGQNGWTADQVFQHHFQLKVAGLVAPLRAHLITQPANRDVPHIRPFDIRLNGVSYFSMPQIFQLGTPSMVVRPVKGKGKTRGGYHGGRNNSNNHEDDAYLSPAERQAIAAAKLASMQDLNNRGGGGGGYGAPAPAAPVADLLSFDAPAPVATPNPYGQPQAPPPQQQQQQQQGQYSNYSLGNSFGSQQQPPAAPPAQQYPGSYSAPQQQQQQQYQQQPMQQQQQQGGYYGQQPPAPQQQQQQQPVGNSFYGQQPPPALAPAPYDPTNSQSQFSLTSPASKSVASYQSYGSAPAFAQPPQQQQQQHQQPQPQQPYYGQPPAPRGY
eukprot:CAMPEP_0201116592 /NCGR_PEP_ID=MMETSP0850-20130426/814_1 /ASSEMBLY_ACC=CAM_ASM_000622 /TAXON_ID=183588 /ORGANISM="Pseudo-nitzschia fraudulenta, Strain WWA7" /LENGTH=404 /DNA_ID=CAMNT_0047380699 /DNA_START=175 /DNA_END=1389 /DNA_ORIENTATION=-